MIECVLRVAAALVATTVTGMFYYNPSINPLVRFWLRSHMSMRHSKGMVHELAGTWFAYGLISCFMMHFLEGRVYHLTDFVALSAMLTFIAEGLQFAHYMWKQGDIRELIVHTVFDFVIILEICMVVTYHYK